MSIHARDVLSDALCEAGRMHCTTEMYVDRVGEEGERERERQTDKQRERDRQTDRQRERERERERKRGDKKKTEMG